MAELLPGLSFLQPFLDLGYPGAFMFSFAGSLLPFVPTPYFIPVALLSLDMRLDPTLVAAASALGSSLAKTIVLRISYAGRALISAESKSRIAPFEKLVSRYGWAAAFFAGATPIPDDIVYIPLGLAKYHAGKFFVAVFAGKLIITLFVAWGARLLGLSSVQFLLESALSPLGIVTWVSTLIALVGVFIYLVLRVNWAELMIKWFPWLLRE